MAAAKPFLGVYENMEFPEYKYQEYPKHLALQDGTFKIVHNRREELDAIDEVVPVKTFDALAAEKAELEAKLSLLQQQVEGMKELSGDLTKTEEPKKSFKVTGGESK